MIPDDEKKTPKKEESSKDNPQTKQYVEQQDTGILILRELQTMNRLLGAINQNITTKIGLIAADVEMCKVQLGRMRKMGAQEVVLKDERPSAPAAPNSPIPGGGQL